MSVTDRAFIKAYSPRSKSPIAAPHIRLPAEPSVETWSDDPYGRATAVPAPHAAADAAAPTRSEERDDAAALTLKFSAPTGKVQPLSAFAPPEAPAPELSPALEVDCFSWPEACDALLARSAAAFDQWAAALAQEAIAGRNLFLMSGLARGEGRSTALLCLARRLAHCGVKTVLVDADFQKPGLAEALGIAPPMGWEDVLTTGAPLQEALIVSQRDELTLLPLGDHVARPLQLVRSLQAPVGLRALAEHFDLVLVDAGPAVGLGATATSLMQQLSDANVILTRDAREENLEALAELESQLRAVEIHLLGVAECFSQPHA